jgi:hypothetical protein
MRTAIRLIRRPHCEETGPTYFDRVRFRRIPEAQERYAILNVGWNIQDGSPFWRTKVCRVIAPRNLPHQTERGRIAITKRSVAYGLLPSTVFVAGVQHTVFVANGARPYSPPGSHVQCAAVIRTFSALELVPGRTPLRVAVGCGRGSGQSRRRVRQRVGTGGAPRVIEGPTVHVMPCRSDWAFSVRFTGASERTARSLRAPLAAERR